MEVITSFLVVVLFFLTGHIYVPMKAPPARPAQRYACPPAVAAALATHKSHLDPALFCRKVE